METTIGVLCVNYIIAFGNFVVALLLLRSYRIAT
jgi:hypothetical protein